MRPQCHIGQSTCLDALHQRLADCASNPSCTHGRTSPQEQELMGDANSPQESEEPSDRLVLGPEVPRDVPCQLVLHLLQAGPDREGIFNGAGHFLLRGKIAAKTDHLIAGVQSDFATKCPWPSGLKGSLT